MSTHGYEMRKITLAGMSEENNVDVLKAKMRRRIPTRGQNVKWRQTPFRGKLCIEVDYKI